MKYSHFSQKSLKMAINPLRMAINPLRMAINPLRLAINPLRDIVTCAEYAGDLMEQEFYKSCSAWFILWTKKSQWIIQQRFWRSAASRQTVE